MRFVRILIVGSLCLACIPAVTAAQSRTVIEMRDAAGPLEKQAKPLAPITLPRRRQSELPAYPWELRRTGARAALIVQVTVNDSGRVVELRRAQGPLLQPVIGSTAPADAQRAAAEAVVRSTTAALSDWKFSNPTSGPITFQLSFGFVGGGINYALTDPAEILPKEATPAPWAGAEGALPTGQINAPKRTKYVKPEYPKTALDKRVQGTVQLEVVIGTDGRVKDARVVQSVPLLDQAAIEATLQARYEPVQVYGNPVTVLHVVSHTFSFKTKSE
jgi:TonB family protein